MKKLLITLLLSCCTYALANQDCKPTLKEYQPNPQATFEYKLSNDLAFSTIQPKRMRLGADDAALYFDDNHTYYMAYQLLHHKANDTKSIKTALLEALDILPPTEDTALFKQLNETDDCQVVELKTQNDLYRVFIIPTFKKEPQPYFNVYLIPNDKADDFVQFLQFKGFSLEEVGQQLATMTKGAKK